MKNCRLFILLIFTTLYCGIAGAQDDKKNLATGSLFTPKPDSLLKKSADTPVTTQVVAAKKKEVFVKHEPRIATRRSAILPGWGQAYNKQYWKIPLVYGVLAIPTALFFYNNSYYKKTKFAFEARYAEQHDHDTSLVPLIDPELKNLSIENLQNYRNVFRRDRDYSILWFLAAWGLQVADATVFAHLRQFNVSDDLSMQVTPVFNPQTRGPGLTLSFNFRNTPKAGPVTR